MCMRMRTRMCISAWACMRRDLCAIKLAYARAWACARACALACARACALACARARALARGHACGINLTRELSQLEPMPLLLGSARK